MTRHAGKMRAKTESDLLYNGVAQALKPAISALSSRNILVVVAT
jgi:hypothetical protein